MYATAGDLSWCAPALCRLITNRQRCTSRSTHRSSTLNPPRAHRCSLGTRGSQGASTQTYCIPRSHTAKVRPARLAAPAPAPRATTGEDAAHPRSDTDAS